MDKLQGIRVSQPTILKVLIVLAGVGRWAGAGGYGVGLDVELHYPWLIHFEMWAFGFLAIVEAFALPYSIKQLKRHTKWQRVLTVSMGLLSFVLILIVAIPYLLILQGSAGSAEELFSTTVDRMLVASTTITDASVSEFSAVGFSLQFLWAMCQVAVPFVMIVMVAVADLDLSSFKAFERNSDLTPEAEREGKEQCSSCGRWIDKRGIKNHKASCAGA